MKTVLLVLIAVFYSGCKSTDEIEPVIGKYQDSNTGEFIEFINDHMFHYDIRADVHPTQSTKRPPFTGTYEMTKKGRVVLSPIPAHLGLFNIAFAEDRSQLVLSHRISGRSAIFVRLESD